MEDALPAKGGRKYLCYRDLPFFCMAAPFLK